MGLHARPADIVSKAVAALDTEVTLNQPGGNPVDAGSALMIMTLGANNGDEVVVTSDDEAAMQRVARLVAQDLDDDWEDDDGNLDEQVCSACRIQVRRVPDLIGRPQCGPGEEDPMFWSAFASTRSR